MMPSCRTPRDMMAHTQRAHGCKACPKLPLQSLSLPKGDRIALPDLYNEAFLSRARGETKKGGGARWRL
jgi:hypothetical protein